MNTERLRKAKLPEAFSIAGLGRENKCCVERVTKEIKTGKAQQNRRGV